MFRGGEPGIVSERKLFICLRSSQSPGGINLGKARVGTDTMAVLEELKSPLGIKARHSCMQSTSESGWVIEGGKLTIQMEKF